MDERNHEQQPRPADRRPPELLTVVADVGPVELHVCTLCCAITPGGDDDQVQHAAWHVLVDGGRR